MALLLCGSGFAYQLGIQQAFLDSLPEQRRGQGFGLNSTGAMGGQGLIPVAAGALAGALGAAPAMAIAGAATILAALALRRPLRAGEPGSSIPNGPGARRGPLRALPRTVTRSPRVIRRRRQPWRVPYPLARVGTRHQAPGSKDAYAGGQHGEFSSDHRIR